MIRLVKGKQNVIAVKVSSFINYAGFRADLLLNNGLQKPLIAIDAANPTITFTPDEIELMGRGIEGVVTVYTAAGDEHTKQREWFSPVASEKEAQDFKKIFLNLVKASDQHGSGGGGGGDVSGLEQRVGSLENKVEVISENIVEVVSEVAPVVVEQKVEPVCKTIIERDVEPMVEEKIHNTVGEINDVLDEINGEVV